MGPVQVLVVGYEQPVFTGEVLAELARLSDAGLVRPGRCAPRRPRR
jgi:hypothetical protein